MLTRLKVSGFKNLADVDVRFGPFTCIAGANGTGKSNLFDAIHFLSSLADRPLVDAALSVRDESGKSGSVRNIFHCVAGNYQSEVQFEAEMIVPQSGADDLGQEAKASITSLKYKLRLRRRNGAERIGPGALEIVTEELTPIRLGEAHDHFRFRKSSIWRKSAVRGRRGVEFISTQGSTIQLHQDGGSRGKPKRSAANLPRTVLSSVNAAESPTATLARNEMLSWRRLQLEPSSLRQPAEFTSPSRLESDGKNLPSTLYRLEHSPLGTSANLNVAKGAVYAQIANRLSGLLLDVRDVRVDRDEQRELLSVVVTDRDGTALPATALSDGTLRFLALAVLELDPETTGVVCLEEPENGIHPARIPAMLQLLQDMAMDTEEEIGPDNPLRQVIINTHSPALVAQVPDDSLVIAELKETCREGKRFRAARFGCLPETWRHKAETPEVSKGILLSYLNPIVRGLPDKKRGSTKRVVDRLTKWIDWPQVSSS